MADAGANAILVGESLMRSENITEAVQNLMVS
jgi:indole-3-glycerol phosphate synthase